MKHTQRTRQLGAAQVWIIVTLSATVAFLGMGLDVGNLVLAGQQLQIAADAAAMAGARYARQGEDEYRWRATYVASMNNVAGAPTYIDYNWENNPDGDVVIGQWNKNTRTFTPGSFQYPNAVKVTARRTDDSLSGAVPLFFGGLLGMDTVNLTRTAIAMFVPGKGHAVIILDENDRDALWVHGNPVLEVTNGKIQVNSNDTRAARFQGTNIEVRCNKIKIVGDYGTMGNPTLPPIYTGEDLLQDPLRNLPEPSWNPGDDLGTFVQHNGVSTLSPGYYSGGITATGGTVRLNPGIYVLDGAGVNITGNTRFIGWNVMLYIKGTGAVQLHGTGKTRLSPPNPEKHNYPDADTYQGTSIFQARDNTNDADMVGNSDLRMWGTYYFPKNHVHISGNSDQFGRRFISNTLEVSGNGELIIPYSQQPRAGTQVTLVQ